MATLLKSTKSNVGSPYIYYAVSAEYMERTETSVRVRVTVRSHLANSASYFLTGLGLRGKIYIGGEWHSITLKSTGAQWRGTTVHSASETFTIRGLNALSSSLSGIKFKVVRTDNNGSSGKLSERSCEPLAISTTKYLYSDARLSLSASSQKLVTANITRLPSGAKKYIEWYLGGVKKSSNTVTGTSSSKSFTGLKPSTRYAVKAKIKAESSSGGLIASRDAYITTPAETATLMINPGARHITAKISGMFLNPSYPRRVIFYIKRSTETAYRPSKIVEGAAASACMWTYSGLVSGVKYDIKIEIRSASTLLKTLKRSVTTVADTSLLPLPFIEEVEQQIGTRQCTLKWFTDKTVSGTTYNIQARAEGTSQWKNIATLTSYRSPLNIELSKTLFPSDNPTLEVRVTSQKNSLVSGQTNVSDPFSIAIIDEFSWDNPKVSGGSANVTANEWNRLGRIVTARNLRKGIAVSIPVVTSEMMLSAELFNDMKASIENLSDVGVSDKQAGDSILASDIDALRIAVNNV